MKGRRGSRARWLACAWCVSLLLSAGDVRAESAGSEENASLLRRLADRVDRSLLSRCLTPAAGTAMNDLVASGALQPVLGRELTLEKGEVRTNQVELQIRDQAHRTYAVTLALPGARSGEPDGRGERFWFYVTQATPPDPRATEALLALARLFDAAIPETALELCGGEPHAGPQEDRRYPRAIALSSAVVEALIVLIAVVSALRTVRHLP